MKRLNHKKLIHQQGVALIFTILLMALSLVVVLSISGLMLAEFKLSRGIEHSFRAYYAAESGIERGLWEFNQALKNNQAAQLEGKKESAILQSGTWTLRYELIFTKTDSSLLISSTGYSHSGSQEVSRKIEIKTPPF